MRLLIFAGNRTHADPAQDRMCWKRGQVVEVQEDNHVWDAGIGLPLFVIVDIPGVPAAKGVALLEAQGNDDTDTPYYTTIPETNPTRGIYRNRAWRVVWASLPAGVQNTLSTTGQITVTVAQVRNYLRRIRDDAQFTGLD